MKVSTSCRYMYGPKDMDHMNLHELQALESNLEIWVHNIRTTKVSFMSFSAYAQTKKEKGGTRDGANNQNIIIRPFLVDQYFLN